MGACIRSDPPHKSARLHGDGLPATSPEITNAGGLWDEANELYPAAGGKAVQDRLEYRFSPKSRVSFRHLEHEKDKLSYQGSQICYLAFDELTHFTESMFFYLLSRNRSKCGVRPYVRCTTNPQPGWVKSRLLGPGSMRNSKASVPGPARSGGSGGLPGKSPGCQKARRKRRVSRSFRLESPTTKPFWMLTLTTFPTSRPCPTSNANGSCMAIGKFATKGLCTLISSGASLTIRYGSAFHRLTAGLTSAFATRLQRSGDTTITMIVSGSLDAVTRAVARCRFTPRRYPSMCTGGVIRPNHDRRWNCGMLAMTCGPAPHANPWFRRRA